MKLKFSLREIANVVGGRFIPAGRVDVCADSISIDSRTIGKREFFIPLIGKNYDGEKFVKDAIAKGAIGSMLTDPSLLLKHKDTPFVLVEDSLKGLQQIAKFRRESIRGLKVVAVTGSSGKSSTKELIGAISATRYKTVKSEGNLNNHIGLPLSLLKVDKDHKVAVIEMGMSSKGEIDTLSKIASPDIGIITNIKRAHLGNFRSIKEIANAKAELIENLPSNKMAILNGDDIYIKNIISKRRSIGNLMTFGRSKDSDLILNKSFIIDGKRLLDISFQSRRFDVKSNLHGDHNDENIMASIAAGLSLKIPVDLIKSGIESVSAISGRMELIKLPNDIYIYNDTYNANPDSTISAIDYISKSYSGYNLMLVFGDMKELGSKEKSLHTMIGSHLVKRKFDAIITVGPLAKFASDVASKYIYSKATDSHKSAMKYIKNRLNEKTVILVKGSRYSKMEIIVDMIKDFIRRNGVISYTISAK